MRIINLTAAAANHLGGNFKSIIGTDGNLYLTEPLSGYGFVKDGLEHIFIECAEEDAGKPEESELTELRQMMDDFKHADRGESVGLLFKILSWQPKPKGPANEIIGGNKK